MITLTCTKCQAVLEMDEAFAGGVCRCQHCGTIQTVPSHLKNSSKAAVGGQKALYSTRTGAGAGGGAIPSSGLDDLASAVASSGISSLAQQPVRTSRVAEYATPATPQSQSKKIIIFACAGALLLLLGGVVAYFLFSGSAPTPAPVVTNGNPTPSPTPIGPVKPTHTGSGSAEPHFATLRLDYKRVVYVVDRGGSGQSIFNAVIAALFDSIDSLGPEREFQVLFWPQPGGNANDFAYPANGTARGNSDRVADIKKQLEDVTASGATEVGPAIREAMKRDPDAVVLITKKGLLLDNNFVKQVLDARKGKNAVIHTIDLDDSGAGQSALEDIAKKTGGSYSRVSSSQLGGK